MKLEAIPVQPKLQDSFKLKPKSAVAEQIDLYLTLQFNEQRDLLPGGRVKFGLKGGELRLKLENGQIPLASSELAGSFELCPPSTTHQQPSSDGEVSSTETEPEAKSDLSTTKTIRRTDQFECLICQVTIKESEENLSWVFEVETGKPVLKGLLKNAKLGTLTVAAKPCRVEATFEVSPLDVYMTKAEGLWPKTISKKRSAVLERAIARRFFERKLKPYVSRQELRYD